MQPTVATPAETSAARLAALRAQYARLRHLNVGALTAAGGWMLALSWYTSDDFPVTGAVGIGLGTGLGVVFNYAGTLSLRTLSRALGAVTLVGLLALSAILAPLAALAAHSAYPLAGVWVCAAFPVAVAIPVWLGLEARRAQRIDEEIVELSAAQTAASADGLEGHELQKWDEGGP